MIMDYVMKFVEYMGTALSLIVTIYFIAIAVWGGSISIQINGLEKFFK